jgi:lysine/ornithine N-monooxygenase
MSDPHSHVAVVGAGPYGLSVSAHLSGRGVQHRVFGQPMSLWTDNMPQGMYLKSEGHASSLSDPTGGWSYRRYAEEHGLRYADIGVPVSITDFIEYGWWFQKHVVPQVEPWDVTSLSRSGTRFELGLSDGTALTADRVVLAIGMKPFPHFPSVLADLPATLASHTVDHRDLGRFSDRDVLVLGAGQSALETAALLHEAGARVRVMVRGDTVFWNPVPPANRSLWSRLRYPTSGLGYGLRLRFYADHPGGFHRLPEGQRLDAVRTTLGPAGAWWLRERVEGRIPVSTGSNVRTARALGDAVELTVQRSSETTTLVADHIIAGTGYRVDLGRVGFLEPGLRQQVATESGHPRLDGSFQSSVPGLHFVGLAAAASFGPVQRFVFGSTAAARRVAAAVS